MVSEVRIKVACLALPLCATAISLAVGCRDTGSFQSGSQSERSVLIHCSGSATEKLVTDFVGAFNRGDLAALDRLVSPEPSFQWYAVSKRPGRRIRHEAENRSSLGAYFASRRRVAERLDVKDFRFDGKTFGYGNFTFVVTRTANDFHTRTGPGKGAVKCTLQPPSIVVWSMG